MDAIISYFIHDTRILLACSMMCRSWYIAAVPHLHHSLTTDDNYNYETKRDNRWPRPLKNSYELGLLPFVKRLRIRTGPSVKISYMFAPTWLSGHTMTYFSALTNLQELGIEHLLIPNFMPTIQQCFGHFSPTLRFLALLAPFGSSRQILYFIGLFPNLQDLKLHYPSISLHYREDAPDDNDTTPAPPSVPPLRGRLMLTYCQKVNLMKEMIDVFGGLRFRHMDLFGVKSVRLLLDACAETLETLKLYPTEPYGEEFSQKKGRKTELK